MQQALYICAQKPRSGERESTEALADILEHTPKKYIILDEFSWFAQSDAFEAFLYTLVQNGHRIVLTGTESFTLEMLPCGELIHRIEIVHCNLFSYAEYCRIYEKRPDKQVCLEYLRRGGLFLSDSIQSFLGVKRYVRQTIIQNLVSYMPDLGERRATAILYAIFYQAVCPFPSDPYSSPTLFERSPKTRAQFFNLFGVSSDITWLRAEFEEVVHILETVGILVSVANADRDDATKVRYYVVNPALSAQLFRAVYEYEAPQKYLGFVMEAATVVHFHHHLYGEDKLYFLKNEFEIDFIIADGEPAYSKHVVYFDAKLRDKPRLESTSSILSDKLQLYFPRAQEDGRYVIYNGPECAVYIQDKMLLFAPLGSSLPEHYEYFVEQVSALIKRGQIFPKTPENPYYTRFLNGDYADMDLDEVFDL